MDSQRKKLIIFDDDEDILSVCSYVMEDDGWQVQTFADCRDILSRVNTFMPDVILMDNWIPDEGGIVATQTLKAEPSLQHIPVIYFSANSDIQSLAAAAGAKLVLPKPFDSAFPFRLTMLSCWVLPFSSSLSPCAQYSHT